VHAWFVNSRLNRFRDAPAAARLPAARRALLTMSADEWIAFKPSVRAVDRGISAVCVRRRAALRHPVQRVHGRAQRHFLAEGSGAEWYRRSETGARAARGALAAAASRCADVKARLPDFSKLKRRRRRRPGRRPLICTRNRRVSREAR
jgi:hypothetical protein